MDMTCLGTRETAEKIADNVENKSKTTKISQGINNLRKKKMFKRVIEKNLGFRTISNVSQMTSGEEISIKIHQKIIRAMNLYISNGRRFHRSNSKPDRNHLFCKL